MKAKSLIGPATALALCAAAHASILAYEPFNYPSGTNISLGSPTATTASGFTGNWMRFIQTQPDGAYVIPGSLPYPRPSANNAVELTHNRLAENVDNSVSGPF